MSAQQDANRVGAKIGAIYDRKKAAVFALAKAFSAECLKEFQTEQPATQGVAGKYWTNHTSDARNRVFSEAFEAEKVIGFFIAHGIEYGVYLELANDRQNAALYPLIQKWGRLFLKEAKGVMA